MGRNDNSISRRRINRNRKMRENMRHLSSEVSTRVATVSAAKKCRQFSKHRLCQGMCFSLPTPEDPLNDRQGEAEPSGKRKRSCKERKNPIDKKTCKRFLNDNNAGSGIQEQEVTKAENGKLALVKSISFKGPEIAINVGKPTSQIIKWDNSTHSWKERGHEYNTGCPSKFLMMCLNSIQNALQQNGAFLTEGDRPLFANAWGIEFWNCYTNGKNVLETNGNDSTVEQIAWMTSTAADTISMKEEEGISFNGPFLMYLVPSRDKASQVREVCKPLKAVGIHTVSLHSGAAIDHQILGLKSCEPEFIISTPERLLELLCLKAVDISEVSLLVIDGLEAPFEGTYFDAVKSIQQFISGNPQTVVFCDCMNNSSISICAKAAGRISLQMTC